MLNNICASVIFSSLALFSVSSLDKKNQSYVCENWTLKIKKIHPNSDGTWWFCFGLLRLNDFISLEKNQKWWLVHSKYGKLNRIMYFEAENIRITFGLVCLNRFLFPEFIQYGLPVWSFRFNKVSLAGMTVMLVDIFMMMTVCGCCSPTLADKDSESPDRSKLGHGFS